MPGYIAIYSVLLNSAVAAFLTLLLNVSARAKARSDETLPADYYALEGIGGGPGH